MTISCDGMEFMSGRAGQGHKANWRGHLKQQIDNRYAHPLSLPAHLPLDLEREWSRRRGVAERRVVGWSIVLKLAGEAMEVSEGTLSVKGVKRAKGAAADAARAAKIEGGWHARSGTGGLGPALPVASQ